MNVAAKDIAEQVGSGGLNPLEFALLRIVLKEEECTSTQLAQMLPVRPSPISQVVTRPVDRGLTSRRRPRQNRRVAISTLAEEERVPTLGLHRRVQAYDSRLSEGVTKEEMASMASATSKILANYAALTHS